MQQGAKIELSSTTQMKINLPYITADASGPKHINIRLRHVQLENLVEPLIKHTIDLCNKALSDAGVKASEWRLQQTRNLKTYDALK
ncbi:hypothetical protein F4604DRAFT_1591179 [Suillus subluteus]|nr:hypothetical protein F4604DRAFT_1594736 [Suillus subluteus]KAG1854494.1 hypothetical protein F4604DRAFT_1591179 [Suillus subluteus]